MCTRKYIQAMRRVIQGDGDLEGKIQRLRELVEEFGRYEDEKIQ